MIVSPRASMNGADLLENGFNIEEVLDMLDLYYRFDWATTNKRIDSNTNIGNLNPEVVLERRRGLEWLISDENDWYDIQLNT